MLVFFYLAEHNSEAEGVEPGSRLAGVGLVEAQPHPQGLQLEVSTRCRHCRFLISYIK